MLGLARLTLISIAIGLLVAVIVSRVWVNDSVAHEPGGLDFIAAQPDDYDHTTAPAVETEPSALQYDARELNEHVVEQFEAEDFSCGDTVVFFTRVEYPGPPLFLQYELDARDSTGTWIGYQEVVAVGISGIDFQGQATETGNFHFDGNESVTLVSQSYSPSGALPPSGFGTVSAQRLRVIVRVEGS